MLASRWEPFAELNRLQDEMNRLFSRWAVNGPAAVAGTYPPVNLWEDDDNLYLEAELPGLELEQMELYVSGGNQLTLKGERKPPQKEGGTWHRQERGHGEFHRVIELPCEVESDQVAAEFSQGVLKVTMPKSPERRPRRIEVKAG